MKRNLRIPILLACIFIVAIVNAVLQPWKKRCRDVNETASSYEYDFMVKGAQQTKAFYSKYTFSADVPENSNCVSPFFADSIPADIASLPMQDKKLVFMQLLVPMIIKANTEVAKERCHLLTLIKKRNKGRKLLLREEEFINLLRAKYRIREDGYEPLLKRVDTVPVSLALAQGIIESGWGTSRFALQGNSLYGVHRPKDSQKKHLVSRSGNVKVAAYDSIYESTGHYIHLLNTARAYGELREMRYTMKKNGQYPNGVDLAVTLHIYSEIGENYIRYIRSVINKNKLVKFDGVGFRPDQAVVQLTVK